MEHRKPEKKGPSASQAPLPIMERDIAFVLFDQLRVQETTFSWDKFSHLNREDVELVLQEAFRFAREKVWPTNPDGDREGCQWNDGKVTIPQSFHQLWKDYQESGWLRTTKPEEEGGAGLPLAVAIAISEVMISGNLAFSPYPGLTRGVARLLERFGADWMQKAVTERLYDLEWAGTMCLTEPSVGTAVGDALTTAVRQEDGTYLIKGTKIFISGGNHDMTPNIVHLVLARTEGAPRGVKGLSLFIVPDTRIDKEGNLGEPNDVYCERIEEKMGLHGSGTCVLNFGDNDRSQAHIVGEENQGLEIMFHLMNEARIGTGLHGLSAGSVAYCFALDYARERIQGVELENIKDVDAPRVPIAKHPDVKRMLHTMRARVTGMRALLYKAGFYADRAFNYPDEPHGQRTRKILELLTPICKAHCSDIGFDVAVMAMQTLGGAGYTQEYPIEQLIRDVKVSSIYEGANGIQALDLIGRKLSKNNGEYLRLFLEEVNGVIEAGRAHPRLGDLAETLSAEVDRLQEVTGFIGGEGLSGKLQSAVVYGSGYLTMLGNIVFGWLLLEQALVAHDRLSEIVVEKQVTSKEARQALLTQDDRALFYENKLRTARFFIKSLLPENAGLALTIQNGDRDILAFEA